MGGGKAWGDCWGINTQVNSSRRTCPWQEAARESGHSGKAGQQHGLAFWRGGVCAGRAGTEKEKGGPLHLPWEGGARTPTLFS